MSGINNIGVSNRNNTEAILHSIYPPKEFTDIDRFIMELIKIGVKQFNENLPVEHFSIARKIISRKYSYFDVCKCYSYLTPCEAIGRCHLRGTSCKYIPILSGVPADRKIIYHQIKYVLDPKLLFTTKCEELKIHGLTKNYTLPIKSFIEDRIKNYYYVQFDSHVHNKKVIFIVTHHIYRVSF